MRDYPELVKALRNNAEHFMTTDFEWSDALVHLLLDSADAIEQKKERAEMIGLDGDVCYLSNTLRQIVISNPNMGAFKKETLCNAADAIEELLKENAELDNSGRALMAAFARIKEKVPRWISVDEQPIPHDWVWGVYRQTICGKVMQHHKTVRMYGDNIVDQEGNIYNGFITHWMPRFPLPAPPKEDAK